LIAELDRWTTDLGGGEVLDETGEQAAEPWQPDYNVAPTKRALAVVRENADAAVRAMRWGLLPHWVKPAEPGVPTKGKPLINARVETAATSAAFRSSWARRRCLVPMDGWYEWKTLDVGGRKPAKVPYFMIPADGSRLYVAGLWAVWRDKTAPELPPVASFTILTTDAVGRLTEVHDRMPLLLPRSAWSQWLDPEHSADPSPPGDVSWIEIRQVSPAVNSVRNNGPELVVPAEPAALF
jgi:putative SOS response-associated peptidase YedK